MLSIDGNGFLTANGTITGNVIAGNRAFFVNSIGYNGTNSWTVNANNNYINNVWQMSIEAYWGVKAQSFLIPSDI